MLRRLYCKLDFAENNIQKYIQGDALQGVIMERIDEDAANELHSQSLNPYSQFLDIRKDGIYWIIQTLTEQAGQQIIEPLASTEFSSFHLNRMDIDISISNKEQSEILLKDLVNRFYFDMSERIFRIRFLTPTAFKSGGEYIFHPDLRLLFGSLMRKYSFTYENTGEEDTEALDSLVENTKIINYNLRSVYSEIGRVRIPAFIGTISIKSTGPQSLVNYMHFLLRFGEYSGAGIKCAMGMGAMKIIEKSERRGLTNAE